MISNPDDVMDTYSVVVTCEINPTSTAEYCEVIARNDDAGKPARSSKLLCTNTCTHVCMWVLCMQPHVRMYIYCTRIRYQLHAYAFKFNLVFCVGIKDKL